MADVRKVYYALQKLSSVTESPSHAQVAAAAELQVHLVELMEALVKFAEEAKTYGNINLHNEILRRFMGK